MAKRKITNTDWKTIMIGLFLTGVFLGMRWYFTKEIDWGYILDTMIAVFGVGVVVFILNEIFGKKIINRLK